MPVIQIKMNIELERHAKHRLLFAASQLTADIMSKPLSDVMAMYYYADFLMDGNFEPTTFIDFRCSSGLNLEIAKALCEGMLRVIQQLVSIDSSRVYINVFEVTEIQAWRFNNEIAICPKSKAGGG